MKLSLKREYDESFNTLEFSAGDKPVESRKQRESKNVFEDMKNKIYHIPLLFTLYCNLELLCGYI
jgi:hypothetical protein